MPTPIKIKLEWCISDKEILTRDGVTVEFYQTFKEEILPIPHKPFQKTEDRIPPNSFYETSITPISKLDRKYKGKKSYSPIFIVNIDAKILSFKKC